MVHLRRRTKRTHAGVGLVLSLLLIAGAGTAIWTVGPSDQEAPVVESPATAHPVETDQEAEPAAETKTPKTRGGAEAKRPEGRRL